MRPVSIRSIVCSCLALGLAGCNDNSSPPLTTPVPPPLSTPASQPSAASYPHGHYRGTAAVGGGIYQFQGGGGAGDLSIALAMSVQLAGHVSPGQQQGSGVVIDQSCSSASPGRFCASPAPADIDLTTHDPAALKGEIHVATAGADEVWSFDLSYWSAYYGRYFLNDQQAGVSDSFLLAPHGTFQEQLAEFALGDDLIITIDKNGLLFFQAPKSGCTGNGRLTPHLDATYSVFDIALRIENCDASHSSLNRDREGLATKTQGGYWEYDDWLVMREVFSQQLRGPPE